MLRMAVAPAGFQPPASIAPVRRLIGSDAGELNRLYALEGDTTWYSGRQINEGVYYGALSRGRLVAAAGTHIHSQREGIAVVGNVFTHPDFRGHGFGTAVTAAVTAHLLQHCGLVVLNVDPGNRPARQIYEKLGYQDTGRVVEALSTLRRPHSPLPLFHRLLGRWRSRTPGEQIVPI
jgi:RimJ/RimL family protein N-acetyltransferase